MEKMILAVQINAPVSDLPYPTRWLVHLEVCGASYMNLP